MVDDSVRIPVDADDDPEEVVDESAEGDHRLPERDVAALPHVSSHDWYTHKPASNTCTVCMRAKTRNQKHMAGASKREPPLHFGDLVTCDHKYYSDPWKFPGVGGYWYSLNILDHATRYRMSIAVRRLTAEKTAAAIRFSRATSRSN